jgi:hypothetical protein
VSLKFLPFQGLGKLLIGVFVKTLCADLIRKREKENMRRVLFEKAFF